MHASLGGGHAKVIFFHNDLHPQRRSRQVIFKSKFRQALIGANLVGIRYINIRNLN